MAQVITFEPLLAAADPQAVNHELAVIGCCLFESMPDVRDFVLAKVADTDLLDRDCRLALKAVRQLVADGERVNLSTLELALERAGLEVGSSFLSELAVDLPDPGRVARYVRALKDARLCRDLLAGARRLAALAAKGDPEALTEARELVRACDASEGDAEVAPLRQHMAAVVATLDRPVGAALGVSTGLPRLDAVTLGLRAGKFVVIAARPGMGKSAMALGFAREAALRGNRSVAYVSLEMSAEEQVRRILAAETGVEHDRIRGNLLNAEERERVKACAAANGGWDLFIDDIPRLDVDEMERRIVGLHRTWGIDLAIVDYLQLVDADMPGRSREQEVAKLSRRCKAIARSLDIPVVVLCQLSRKCEERPDKRPQLHDLRESGSLEQDCDLALLLFREGYYNSYADQERAEIIVAKQRDGATGIVYCRFDGARMRFLP